MNWLLKKFSSWKNTKPGLIWHLQISDYNQLPDVARLSEQLKTCLQESDDIPRDITSLFDNSLFRLDTSLVSKSIKWVQQMDTMCLLCWESERKKEAASPEWFLTDMKM